jgi:hypothetical protein
MDVQLGIIESNIRIYQTVLPWLIDHRIPFVFTSSYLQVIFHWGNLEKIAPIGADILSTSLLVFREPKTGTGLSSGSGRHG